MKLKISYFLLALGLVSLPPLSRAQAWTDIIPSQRAIDWSTAGIPGGIPTRTTVCTTLSASSFGNGSSDASGSIQKALGSCGSGQVVSLSAGTFLITGNIVIPGNVTLRGAGANQTILNSKITSGAPITIGNGNGPSFGNAVSITGGTSAGSTTITVSSASGIKVGGYLLISQLNDGSIVTNVGSEGTAGWVDGGEAKGTRAQGQISEVTSVNGTSIGINPGLFVSYTNSPHATQFSATKYAGVESLQIYANKTHTSGTYSNFVMNACAYCWIEGVEGNYTDGDHVDVYWSYHGQISDSYFSNSFLHTPGTYDSNVDLLDKTTGLLVQNNIFERLHTSIMLEWGAAGNVIAYNYSFGAFDSGAPGAAIGDIDLHGAHPQFNLFEGNVVVSYGADSVWGSHANNTFFRNWARGTTKGCNPLSGRSTVSCLPLGTPGSGANGWWEFQDVRAVNPTYLTSSMNEVGNVVGSADMAALIAYGNPQAQVDKAWSVCGAGTPCGGGSRAYDGKSYAYTFGYGETSDSGASAFSSLTAWSTFFLHGDYSNVTGTTTWAPGVTNSLPQSFYLSGKPSWWGSMPFPAIGPDVTGGPGPGGHTYPIPAQNCYQSVMNGTDGTGSPLTNFNSAACYGGGSTDGSPGTTPPASPSGLTAIVH
jgi:hypothetical protein